MIRIVHVITGLGDGGSEAMLEKLLSSTNGQQVENRVVSLTTIGPVGERIRHRGIRVHALGMRSGLWNLVKSIELAHKIGNQEADLIQTWMYHANVVGGIAGKLVWRLPVIWNVRAAGSNYDGYPTATVVIARGSSILSHFIPDKIVFNSQSSRENHLKMGYDRDKACIIPNGFDTNVFRSDPLAREEVRAELGIPADVPLVGLVARYHPQKDHRTFLEAASSVAKRFPEVHFLLCGGGVTRQTKALATWVNRKVSADRFHLIGPREDIARVTATLDIACSSSISESFSNTIGEAMACGVPCVVTDVGDSSSIVGDTGIVVPPRRPEMLAAAWTRLLRMGPSERAEMGAAARRRIEERYSLPAVVAQYEKLYQELLRANDFQ